MASEKIAYCKRCHDPIDSTERELVLELCEFHSDQLRLARRLYFAHFAKLVEDADSALDYRMFLEESNEEQLVDEEFDMLRGVWNVLDIYAERIALREEWALNDIEKVFNSFRDYWGIVMNNGNVFPTIGLVSHLERELLEIKAIGTAKALQQLRPMLKELNDVASWDEQIEFICDRRDEFERLSDPAENMKSFGELLCNFARKNDASFEQFPEIEEACSFVTETKAE